MSSYEDLLNVFYKQGAFISSKEETITAMAVVTAESGRNPTVYNGSCCYGWFQINLSAHGDKIPGNSQGEKIRSLRDPEINTQVAWKIFQDSGWSPWEVYTTGSYKKYLGEAEKAYVPSAGAPPDKGDITPNIPSPLDAIGNALAWITHPHNWLRIAAFIGGLAVLLLAGSSLLRQTKIGKQTTGIATAVATRGRA